MGFIGKVSGKTGKYTKMGLNQVEKKQVNSIIKKAAETKFKSVSTPNSGFIGQTGQLVPLIPDLGQGLSVGGRDGNKITLHSLKWRGALTVRGSEVVRMLIVQQKDLAPTASDILASADCYNFINYTDSNVEILYDRLYTPSLQYVGSDTVYKIDIALKDLKRVRKTLRYEGDGSVQPANSIQAFFISDTASLVNRLAGKSSMFYKDL